MWLVWNGLMCCVLYMFFDRCRDLFLDGLMGLVWFCLCSVLGFWLLCV